MNSSIWAVVPAGGKGERFSSQDNKLLAPLHGKPVLHWTLSALLATPCLSGIVIATQARQDYQPIVDALPPEKPVLWAGGGPTRRLSVRMGVLATPPGSVVVVHDAARPLITPELITRAMSVFTADPTLSGLVVGLPMTDTVKITTDGQTVLETADRKLLWTVQTPQITRRETLLAADKAVPASTEASDEMQLLELAEISGGVRLFLGERQNLKITTPADLQLAEALLQP
jgi:2-C-methyl-D-erythritol 4-phosphate cytidylyltransferase